MVSRHYRDTLQQALSSADDESIGDVFTNWSRNSRLLDEVSRSIRESGRRVDSEIEGQAGIAMVAKFAAISDRLDEDSARMKKGSEALDIAQAAALEAIKARNGIQLSGPMNQPPTKPAGPTPGTQPTPEQETAMGQYNAQMNTYLANEQAAEDKARAALEHLDAEYARAADVMREVHGEPDPEDTPTTPVSGGGGGGGGLPPTGPVSPPGTPSTPESRDPRDPRGPRDSAIVEVRDPHIDDTTTTTTTTPTVPTGHTPHQPPHVPPYVPGTNVGGGTDGGFGWSPAFPAGGGTGPSGPTAAGGSVSGAGMAAGGIAGGAAGAAGMRGSTPAAPLRSAGVKGIGATNRPSAPGSLSRGAGAGSTGARGASSAARGASVGGPAEQPHPRGAAGAAGGARAGAAGAGGRPGAGAAGANGAAQRGATGRSGAAAAKGSAGGAGQGRPQGGQGKGKGLFRRGSNGSTAGAAVAARTTSAPPSATRWSTSRTGWATRPPRRACWTDAGPASRHHGRDGLRRVGWEVERRRRSASLHELGAERSDHRAVVGAQPGPRHAHPDPARLGALLAIARSRVFAATPAADQDVLDAVRRRGVERLAGEHVADRLLERRGHVGDVDG